MKLATGEKVYDTAKAKKIAKLIIYETGDPNFLVWSETMYQQDENEFFMVIDYEKVAKSNGYSCTKRNHNTPYILTREDMEEWRQGLINVWRNLREKIDASRRV